MNSFNHYAYGAVGEWLYDTVAGIAPDPRSPAFKHIRLQPALCARLSRVEARLDSPFGEIRSAWTLHGGKFRWEIRVPPNTEATACLPAASATGIKLDGRRVPRAALTSTKAGWELSLSAGSYRITIDNPCAAPPENREEG
jgi:alpha-L-rhamnosidase